MDEQQSKRKFEKRTYPRKVKKTRRLQVFCRLLGTRVQVHLFDDWSNHLNSIFLMREKTTNGSWVTGPVTVIKPLPVPLLGLEGDDFFGLSTIGMTNPFLNGWSSFPSLFRLDDPLMTTLGADEEAPSFSFCLRATADALTKALYLATSIFAKGKR